MKFFEDEQIVSRKAATLRMPPTIPATGWKAPSEFPNLSDAVAIGYDCETYDPNLLQTGPGWARGEGHMVGYSLAAIDRRGNMGSWYFPMRHIVCPEENLDPANCLAFLKHTLERPDTDKVGANLTYDIGYAGEEGIDVAGDLYDVQFAEALIDNEGHVNLEFLANKYLSDHKDSNALYEWSAQAYGGKPNGKQRANIYRCPPRLVGPYGEADAHLPLRIFQKQQPILIDQALWYAFRLECDIIPMMIAMRREGVRVDLEAAARLHDKVSSEITGYYSDILHDYGFVLESTDSRQLAKLLDSVGIAYPRTEADNPSISKEWLAALEHPLGDVLNDLREHEKMKGTFIEAYIFNKNINGKIFPTFHQMRGETNGTKVYRFASSDPNLQNIPARTKLGKLVREIFVPDVGHAHWRKFDYSQIHYRILAHNAVDDGDGSADELREAYRNNPKMDYHNKVYANVCPFMGWDYDDEEMKDFRRRPIKNVNFGLLYGQAIKALMYKTAMYFGSGFTQKQAQEFIDAYFKGAPYVKPTMAAIAAEVQENGYVTTLQKRRIRFNLFEPANRHGFFKPLPFGIAIHTYGAPLKYAFDYRGVNYRFQGTEPEIMKDAMRALWRSGVLSITGVPRLTVHDELDWSVRERSKEQDEAFAYIKHTMENTTQLRVPIYVDMNDGENWAKAK